MEIPFSRGSEWRRWDLHIHSDCGTPETIIQALTEKQISVFAITDHASVENVDKYFALADERQRQGEQIYFLPGVELRTDKGNKSVHMVAIFPPMDKAGVKIDSNYLKENLLAKINCSRADIVAAGRLAQKDGASETECHTRGLLEKVVDFEDAAKKVHELGGLVIVHAGSKSSGIEKEMNHSKTKEPNAILESLGHTKRTLMKEHIDICELPNWETPNLKERDFYAKTFSKPSIISSDSHSVTGIGEKFSWIKADPTFEGLMQIKNEPVDRVYLGKDLPNLKADENVIDKVAITDSNQWFRETPILLSDGLVSIIGERGSGKTALADLIALAGGDYKQDQDENSFIKKALKATKQIEKTIEGTKIRLTWKNGDQSDAVVMSNVGQPVRKARVKYLSQGFIEKKCDPRNSQDFRREIENVIFQRIPPKRRMEKTSFEELRSYLSSPLDIRNKECLADLEQLHAEIFDIEQRRDNLGKLENEKSELTNKNKTLKSQKSKPTTNIEKAIEAGISVTEKHKDNLESQVSRLNRKRQTIISVKTKVQKLKSSFSGQIKQLREELTELGLSSMANRIRLHVPEELDESLQKLDKKLLDDVKNIEGDTKASTEWAVNGAKLTALSLKGIKGFSLASCDEILRSLEAKSSIAQRTRSRLNEISTQIRNNTRRITAITTQVAEIKNQIEKELPRYKAERSLKYNEYLSVLSEEKDVLDDMYLPLRERVGKEESKIHEPLLFFARMEFDVEKFYQVAVSLIDFKRKGRYFQDADLLFSDIKRIAEQVEIGGKTDILPLLTELEVQIRSEDGELLPLKKNVSAKEFYDWLYNPGILSVNYSIKFEGINVELLSPGKKGIILLLIYLSLDTESTCPLIIDQPEENLDNRSVYADLMGYFRLAKERRQIIVVSHNPNLVINTDSEQLVVATFDSDPSPNNPRIDYVCGAIENVHVDSAVPGLSISIHEQGSDILEGGRTAFVRRKDKWAF